MRGNTRVPAPPTRYPDRARRPRRDAHTGMPSETPAGTRAAGDVGPYQGTRKHKVPYDANHVIMVGRDVHGATRTRGRQRRRRRDAGRRRRRPLPGDTREHKVLYDDVMRHHWNMLIFAGIKPRSTEQDLPSTTSDRFIGICPSFHLKRKTSWNPCASSIKPSMIY